MWERNDDNWLRKVEKVESMVLAGVVDRREQCELNFGKF